jgi:hypothetical protein
VHVAVVSFSCPFLINNSVVDWDTALFVPAPSAIQHPLFLANIPGWQNDDVPMDMTFEEDRSYLENAIGKLDAGSQNPGQIEYMLRTSFERQFFELSLHNRWINDEYIQRRFKNTRMNREAALKQLEEFLSVHESMRALPAVLEVQSRLNQDFSSCAFNKRKSFDYKNKPPVSPVYCISLFV